MKLSVKSGKSLPVMTLKLNTPVPLIAISDANGFAFFLVPGPIADSYTVEVSDSLMRYYLKSFNLDVRLSKSTHSFFMELNLIETRSMVFKVTKGATPLKGITVTVGTQEMTHWLGGQTDDNGVVIFQI